MKFELIIINQFLNVLLRDVGKSFLPWLIIIRLMCIFLVVVVLISSLLLNDLALPVDRAIFLILYKSTTYKCIDPYVHGMMESLAMYSYILSVTVIS